MEFYIFKIKKRTVTKAEPRKADFWISPFLTAAGCLLFHYLNFHNIKTVA